MNQRHACTPRQGNAGGGPEEAAPEPRVCRGGFGRNPPRRQQRAAASPIPERPGQTFDSEAARRCALPASSDQQRGRACRAERGRISGLSRRAAAAAALARWCVRALLAASRPESAAPPDKSDGTGLPHLLPRGLTVKRLSSSNRAGAVAPVWRGGSLI